MAELFWEIHNAEIYTPIVTYVSAWLTATEILTGVFLHVTFIVFLYIGFPEDSKHSYYTAVLVLEGLAIVGAFPMPLLATMVVRQRHDLFLPLAAAARVFPLLITVVNVVLCVHRVAVFFNVCSYFNDNFKWICPLVTLMFSAPVWVTSRVAVEVTMLSAVNDPTLKTTNTHQWIIRWVETVVRVCATAFLVATYSTLLRMIKRQQERANPSNVQRQSSAIIYQTLPITAQLYYDLFFAWKVEQSMGHDELINSYVWANLRSGEIGLTVPLAFITGSNVKREFALNKLRQWIYRRRVIPQVCNVNRVQFVPHEPENVEVFEGINPQVDEVTLPSRSK